MKNIGIIGGLGPESTLDYYKGIISAFAEAGANYNYPQIFIHSLNLRQVLDMFDQNAWDQLAALLVDSAQTLHAAGADFAVIASNTPHLVFDQVQAASPLPLISIVEATCCHAQGLGLKRPGLLATATTMASDLYQKAFAPQGMEVTPPATQEQGLIQERLFSEIERGIFKDSTRDDLLGIVTNMQERHGIDSVILGCTELPLILTRDYLGLPFLNTTAIHVAAMVEYCQAD